VFCGAAGRGDHPRKSPRITAKLNNYEFEEIPLFTPPQVISRIRADKIILPLEWPGLFCLGIRLEGFGFKNEKNRC
jgi:hypothetical protein